MPALFFPQVPAASVKEVPTYHAMVKIYTCTVLAEILARCTCTHSLGQTVCGFVEELQDLRQDTLSKSTTIFPDVL